jgi:hypothetical protein
MSIRSTALSDHEKPTAGGGGNIRDEPGGYGRAASHLRRLLETVGLERKPRTINPPSVEEYARHVAGGASA